MSPLTSSTKRSNIASASGRLLQRDTPAAYAKNRRIEIRLTEQ
jgi:hypothetical protein